MLVSIRRATFKYEKNPEVLTSLLNIKLETLALNK